MIHTPRLVLLNDEGKDAEMGAAGMLEEVVAMNRSLVWEISRKEATRKM